MTYLLDTNACIQYLNSSNNRIVKKMASFSPDDIFLCDVVKFELYYGAYRSVRQDKNLETLAVFFDELVSFPFDGKAAKICGYIRNFLNQKGTPIGVYDLQIASIALSNELILVTHNITEFSRVEGLKYEDWELG